MFVPPTSIPTKNGFCTPAADIEDEANDMDGSIGQRGFQLAEATRGTASSIRAAFAAGNLAPPHHPTSNRGCHITHSATQSKKRLRETSIPAPPRTVREVQAANSGRSNLETRR